MTDFRLDGQPPHLRDPGEFPWGYYLDWSMGAGGAQGFHWFATETEALQSLRELDDALFVYGLEELPDGQPNPMTWLLGGVNELAGVPIDLINALQSVATLRWAGHRDSLLTCPARFARGIRHDFIDHWADPRFVPTPPGAFGALFNQHLMAYAKRFQEVRYVSPYSLGAPEGRP